MAAALQRNMETPHLRHERIPVSVQWRSRSLLQSLYSSLLTPTRFSSSVCMNAAIPARHASIKGFAARKMQSGVLVPDVAACVWVVCEVGYLRPCTCELRACRFVSKERHDQYRGKREARRKRGTHLGKIQRGPREKGTKTLCITSPIRCYRACYAKREPRFAHGLAFIR
jgi:hypothetical protein